MSLEFYDSTPINVTRLSKLKASLGRTVTVAKNQGKKLTTKSDARKPDVVKATHVDHASEPITPPKCKSKSVDQIYVTLDGKFKLLRRDLIRTTIFNICQQINVPHLDVDKITDNVYPKLKTQNTLEDVININKSNVENIITHDSKFGIHQEGIRIMTRNTTRLLSFIATYTFFNNHLMKL